MKLIQKNEPRIYFSRLVSFVKYFGKSVNIMVIETSSVETEILKLLAKLHVVTHEQLFRLLPEFERHYISSALNLLKNLDYLYVKGYEIPAPNAGIISKNVKKVSTLTYALNYKSRAVMQRKFPILDAYYRHNPKGLRYQSRIYHDLLIVEAALFIRDRYTIADIYNEEFLQRTRQTMADLRLKLDDECANFEYVDIEIVVGNSKSQIKKKPETSLFFTYSSYQADIIEQLTGRKAIILSVGGDEIKREKDDFTAQKYDESYEYIHFLDTLGGALSAEALAIAFNKDVGETKLILRELEENGHLFCDRTHLNIGDKGARSLIYAVNRALLKERNDRVLALMCSNLIINLKDEVEFRGLDRSERAAYFQYKTGERRIYYLENSDFTPLENYLAYRKLRGDRKNIDAEICVHFVSEARKREFLLISGGYKPLLD